MTTNQLKRVAIVGGTHGNELLGSYLVKKFEKSPSLIQRTSFESLTLLANPEACAVGRRYIDRDLNRCFLSRDLSNPMLSSYEDRRARTINQMLGPKGNSQVNFIIDLHSTTANMGLTIIPASDHPFNLRLAAYFSAIHPLVKVYRWPQSGQEQPFLRSISELGCTIELGAIAQGVLDARLFQQTEELLSAILDYLDAHNQGKPLSLPPTMTVYQGSQMIDYPRTPQGELQAMIHPQLQFQDYQPLNSGDPMFLSFEGKEISYESDSTVYPVFVNEAAYYEKGIAMCLTQKQHIDLGVYL